MITKNFGGKKVTIRKASKRDLKKISKFQDYINSLIKERAQISLNKKVSLKEERKWLEGRLKNINNHRAVSLIAESDNIVVGNAGIDLRLGSQSHVGEFGITIRQGYRGMGLGKYLMKEIIKLAKKELKPRPKIIRLSVFSTNKPAISLYKKMGFKKAAVIPKQFQFQKRLVNEIVMLLYM